MQKRDLIWLTRNTDIENICKSMEDCVDSDVLFKIFRKQKTALVEEIFAAYPTQRYKDQNGFCYVQVKGFKVNDLADEAQQHNADILYNEADGKFYYIPADTKAYLRTFRRSSPSVLYNLSTRKKLDILFALSQDCFVSQKVQKNREDFLEYNSDKLNALLNLQIPPEFWEDEKRKIRLITAEIAKIPDIKQKLQNFHLLPKTQKKGLFKRVSEITAEFNRITTPNLFLVTDKKVREFNHADWIDAEAFATETDIYINTDKLKNLQPVECLLLPWHETNHVAQSYGDYAKYPIMEDILSLRLNYLNEHADVYIMHPQEKVNYALEKLFIEESINRIGIKPDKQTYLPRTEYDVATQYMIRSMQRKF